MGCNFLFSHPTGNANVLNAALALEKAGVLSRYHTTIAPCGGNILSRFAKLPGFSPILRRQLPDSFSTKLRLHPSREAFRLIARCAGLRTTHNNLFHFLSIDSVYKSFDRQVARSLDRDSFSAVYCYEDGALETFRIAKLNGLTCIYDLPIAHWKTVRQLMAEEAERLPDWACTIEGLQDSEKKLRRKDEELDMADVVICPSLFVRDSLPLDILKRKRVEVVPFGSPLVFKPIQKTPKAGPLKVLFVGSMSQRKGLADLFAAIKILNPNHFELHVLGTPIVDIKFYRSQLQNFIHHTPRAHSKVLELMQSCDVFVLPSIVEGRALVQQEAMSCGMPIIVTKNAGGEDLVADEKAGFLVPIRNPNAIAEKLEMLFKNRELLDEMGKAAESQAQSLTWSDYQKKIVEIVKTI